VAAHRLGHVVGDRLHGSTAMVRRREPVIGMSHGSRTGALLWLPAAMGPLAGWNNDTADVAT